MIKPKLVYSFFPLCCFMTNSFNLFGDILQVWDRISYDEDDTVSVLLDNQDIL